ncbi:hypothetical protein GCM10011364_19870 [Mangrovimonas yunxiaonensis]|nr:hypothetical protein GCM10011364_19870 [Mangrovimonas yunxiaonensis]
MDDGSTDGTEDLMAEYMERDIRFRYYHRPAERPKGPCSCRNYGFEQSKGDYVNFFDSDDIYKLKALETWLGHFKNDIDTVVSKVELIRFNDYKLLKTYDIASDKLLEDFFTGRINFFVCGALWKRDFLINKKMLFDETLRNGDDWDFNLRMLYNNPRIIFLDSAIVQNRVHENSLSKERSKLNKDELKSYFTTLTFHLQEIKKEPSIDKALVEDYVISRYYAYLKLALRKGDGVKFYIFLELVKREFLLKYYLLIPRTIMGFLIYVLSNRGYNLLNLKNK